MGLGEADQMSDCPGNDVIVAVKEAVALLGGSDNAGNIAGYRRLFGDDGDGRCGVVHADGLTLFSLITRRGVYVF